jgi:hypothetical protein
LCGFRRVKGEKSGTLESTGGSIGEPVDVGDLSNGLEGLSDGIVVNLKGKISDKYSGSSLGAIHVDFGLGLLY